MHWFSDCHPTFPPLSRKLERVFLNPLPRDVRTAHPHLQGLVAEPGPQSPHVCEAGQAQRVPRSGPSAGLLQIVTSVPNL